MIPGVSGGEVSEKLKEDARTKDIPVIFLTGLMRRIEAEKRSGLSRGNFFMAKPCDLNKLLEEIQKRLPGE